MEMLTILSLQDFFNQKRKKKKDHIKFPEVQIQLLVGLACLKIIFNTSIPNEILSNSEL